MDKRLAHIDFAAGIMIIWMIIYHALCYANVYNVNGEEITNPCLLFPYLSFFMPWFFYKSGQFFKKRTLRELWARDSRKLLLTFAIWSAIGYIMYLIFGVVQNYLTLRGATYSIVRGLFLTGKIPINEPLWFLTTLFGVRVIANWLLPGMDEKNGWIKIMGIVFVGYAIACICYLMSYRLMPFWVANGASGLAFFAIGYGIREYEKKWWLIVPCALVYIVCCIVGFPMVDMMYNELLSGNYLLWMPVAACGIIIFNVLCRLTTKYIRIKPIEKVGQNAMTIYVTHILIVLSVQFVITYFHMAKLFPYLVQMFIAGYVVFLPILCYFVPKAPILVGRLKK